MTLSRPLFILMIVPLVIAAQPGEALYQLYCAGCHGKNLEGVNGAHPLRKTEWIYSRDPGVMLQTILYGLPGTEMAAFGTLLRREQATAIRDYIVDQQNVPPETVRALPNTLKVGTQSLSVEVIVSERLKTPWGIEFVDEQRALVTEREGGLRWIVDGQLDPNPVEGMPTPILHADSGMFDLALDPDYASNGWIYIGFSHPLGEGTDKGSPGMTKVIRGRIKDGRWTDEEALFERPAEDYIANVYRWGCRLLFDRDGYLYFTVGDHARNDHVQDLSKPSGKIYRIHKDGSIPPDNPFLDHPRAIPSIYTIGNRNAQGLAQHPITGEIWATEHGPMGGDELNIIRRGANYGWPLVTYGREYNGTTVSKHTEMEGILAPITQWTPSIAVCPAEFYTGDLFPDWKNDLFVGALAYEEIRRLEIEDQQVVSQEIILKNYGRVRDLKTGPEGALYVVLNRPDLIFRLLPTNGDAAIKNEHEARLSPNRLDQESTVKPQLFIVEGLDPDGSLRKHYRRGLDYAIDYFGNYGPYNIYLLGPGNEESVRAIYRKRAASRVIPGSSKPKSDQIQAFLNQSNVRNEIEDVLAGRATGGLTWSDPARRVYEDVTTNATERANDPVENTWGALHEYHHVFQIAHTDSYQDRSSERNLNSWMVEGGATYSSAWFMEKMGLADFQEYMLALRKSGANIGRPGINEFLENHPDYRLDVESYWETGEFPQVYYMLGAWATAYLIHVQGIDEGTVLRDWYRDVLDLGKTAAFTQHMRMTPAEFYQRFDRFIRQPDELVMKIFGQETR